MRIKLILALICLLLIVQTVSAENKVVNGDFETGDFTGWSHNNDPDSNRIVEITSDAHNGSYAAKLQSTKPQDTNGGSTARLWQTVDLTDVDEISFYYKFSKYGTDAAGSLKFYIDGDKKYEGTHGGWTQVVVDVSDLTGNHTIKFEVWVAGPSHYLCEATAIVDDVVAEAATEVHNYNVTFNFVNSETGLPLNGVEITLEIYKNGELRSTWDTVVDSGFTLEVSEGSMIQVKQASKSGFISELEQAGMYKIIWVDPDLNPFLTNPYNVTIVFYPTTTNARVHFIFIDTKTNAQIPDVDFVLKDSGDHVIADGTYDYEFVLENATRGQWYWYNASKPGYFSTWGGYQVPTDSQTDYYVYVYLTPVTQASDEENNTVVEFQILDSQTWNPIDGAVVTLNGVSKVTNSAGFAHFEVAKNNTYSYLVSAEGYYSKSGVVEVGTDQVLETVYLLALPSGGGGGGAGGGGTGGGTGGTGGGGSTGTGGGETGGGTTTGGGGGIDTGYTPDEGLRQAARDTLTQFYKSVPGFFGLIFLLFIMASLQSVMRGFRR